MRKLLLAGTALIGSVAVAAAQTPTMPYPGGGFPTAPGAYLGGNNSFDNGVGPLTGPSAPTPGTVTVHLNGRVWGYLQIGGGSAYSYNGNKVAPEQYMGYFRLYPGVDAMATNGLRYGAIVEIRQNFNGSATQTSGYYGSSTSSGASGASSGASLYVRREAIYVGSNELGILRLGQDDGPFSQFDNGVTTFQFGTGAFNGDTSAPGASTPTNWFPFWSGIGNEYTISKAVYFSPQFSGFDFAVSFAPNTTPNNDAACGVAASGCNSLSTSTVASDAQRATNMFEAMGRYQGTIGGLGIYGIAGYSGSGNVSAPAQLTAPTGYNGFSVGDVGLVLTYAGISVGGNVIFGAMNGQVGLQPKGAPSAVGWLAGVQYTSGPFYVAAAYMNYQEQGQPTMTGKSQAYNDGVALGTGYTLAPGLNLYAEYLYGKSHQGGWDLLAGKSNATLDEGNVNNDVNTSTILLGARVQW